jgi:hypothetical protein
MNPFTLPPRDTWIDRTSEVETDRDTLYALLSDIDLWPEWTPGLKSIVRVKQRQGKAEPGALFVMNIEAPLIRRLILPCVMYQNTPDRIEWGGGVLGSTIRHYMELTPLGPGRTRLRHVECASGLLAVFGRPARGFAHMHDARWSQTIEDRFAQADTAAAA